MESKQRFVDSLKSILGKSFEGKYFLFKVESIDTQYHEEWYNLYQFASGELVEVYSPNHVEYGCLDVLNSQGLEMTCDYLEKNKISEVYCSYGVKLDVFQGKESYEKYYEENEESGEEEFESSHKTTAWFIESDYVGAILNSYGVTLIHLGDESLENLLSKN